MSGAMKMVCHDCGTVNRVPAARLGAGPKCGTCGTKLTAGKVRELDLKTLEKSVRTDDVPLLVDFWAPWCGPCRMMAPEFAKAGDMLAPGVRLAKIDTQSHPDAAIRYSIRGIPALILFRGGREVARKAGAMPAAGIAAFVRAHVKTDA